MTRKANKNLTAREVCAMGLREFERRFGFRPRDAYEKQFFAAVAKRPSPMEHDAVRAGVLGEIDVSSVNMAD